MADRFKELSTQCMKELTEVFNRMDDSNVTHKENRQDIPAGSGKGRTVYPVLCHEADASWQAVLLDLG